MNKIIKQLFAKITKNPLYLQIVFALLAFVIMVVLSYFFMSNIVHRELVHNAENMLGLVQGKIDSALHESEALLNIFSQSVRHLILHGADIDALRKYIIGITEYTMVSSTRMSYIDGFYGYFELPTGEFSYITGASWTPPLDYAPHSRPWYQAAIAAGGNIALTEPYINLATGNIVFTFTRSLYDDDGNFIGITCLDVSINIIGGDIVATAAMECC
jgi:methyl-accepting chemotaxis protein